MSSSNLYNRGRNVGSKSNRGGFTLTELLIGITIIGLLIGMLAVVGGQAIGTSREFAVNTEIVQMSQALESFKTKYGFYPPSFEQFSRLTTDTSNVNDIDAELNQFLPYLNRISPNHQQTLAQLRLWWVNVGVNLDQRSSLVFWLSGLAHNKQFPLTHPVDGSILTAYDNGTVERQKLYSFDESRLRDLENSIDGSLLANVQGYEMAHGKQNGDRLFVYRDAAAYIPGIFAAPSMGFLNPVPYVRNPSDPDDATLSLAYHFYNPAAPGVVPAPGDFVNPDTFQLICFGLDGDGGEPLNPDGTTNLELRGAVLMQGPNAIDNLCNFAGGRLDKFVNDNL